MQLTFGMLIPFIGTTIGAAMVFLMKNEINKKIEKLLLGFASGVMIAASVWSLLIPSIEMAEEQGVIAWIPASVGFLIGVVFLLVLDYIIRRIKKDQEKTENEPKKKSGKSRIFIRYGSHFESIWLLAVKIVIYQFFCTPCIIVRAKIQQYFFVFHGKKIK